MRMLYLYRGWNSGTNQAMLNAWRGAMPEMEIEAYDVSESMFPNLCSKLKALPWVLRQKGLAALLPGQGRYVDAIKRTTWYAKRTAMEIDRLQTSNDFDCSLAIGTMLYQLRPQQPHFIYTDHTMKANAYYPEGRQRLESSRDCLTYEEESLRKATMVFTMSEHISRSLVEQYGLAKEKILRVNGGCNSPMTCKPANDRFERMNVLFIGVDWERKGGPQLAEAFAVVRKRNPLATLTIIGCEPGISAPGIEIVGRVSHDQVSSHLAQASVFCMVSRLEPFGIAYIEAMRAGLPVIASNLGATPDFVHDGITGYLVAPDDTETLADRLEELLGNPELSRRMGAQAQQLAESEYTWQRTQKKMWEAIILHLKCSSVVGHEFG